MPRLPPAWLAAALLGACASPADDVHQTAQLNCRDDPLIGTNIAKRDRCTVSTEKTREAARRQAEALREDATIRQQQRPVQ